MKKYDKILQETKKVLGNKVTSGHQLDKFGKDMFEQQWLGIFTQDVGKRELTAQIKKTAGLFRYYYGIMNNDKTGGPGEHWVGIIIDTETKTVYIYDSFGRTSKKLLSTFTRTLNGNGYKHRDADYDKEQLESEENCGSRAAGFLVFADNYGLNQAMKI